MKLLRALLTVAAVGSIFVAVEYWASAARKRDWWWIDGGPTYMFFGDVSSISNSKGHLLYIEKNDVGLDVTEIDVIWKCPENVISWHDAWKLGNDMEKAEHYPPPNSDRGFHQPKGRMEANYLALACQPGRDRSQLQVLHPKNGPVEMTKSAFEMVSNGVDPFDALVRSAGLKAKVAK